MSKRPGSLVLTGGCVLTGMLLVFAPAMEACAAEYGGSYIEAYNDLVRMLRARYAAVNVTGVETNNLSLKNAASTNETDRSVVQSDLNGLRTDVVGLIGSTRYVVGPADFHLAERSDVAAFRASRSALLRGIGNDAAFTRVPARFTSDGIAQYSDSFGDVPPLDVHFHELYAAIRRLAYCSRPCVFTNFDGSSAHNNVKDSESLSDEYSTWSSAVSAADALYASSERPNGGGDEPQAVAATWGLRFGSNRYGAQKFRAYVFARNASALATATPHRLHYYCWGGTPPTFWDPGLYGKRVFDPSGVNIATNLWTLWSVSPTSTASYVYSEPLGTNAVPVWCPEPTLGIGNWSQGFQTADKRAIVQFLFDDPPPKNPFADDSDEDGLIDHGCGCEGICAVRPEAAWKPHGARSSLEIPLGQSSGLQEGGIVVRSYVTDYLADGCRQQMHNLDTRLVLVSSDVSGKWRFVTVKRPTGADVVFSLKGANVGWPVNARRNYRLQEVGGDYEIQFGGQRHVVHRFDGASKAIEEVRAMAEHQVVTILGSPTQWPRMRVYTADGLISSNVSPSMIALPEYGSNGLIGRVTYRDHAGNALGAIVITNGSVRVLEYAANNDLTTETRLADNGETAEIWRGVASNGVPQIMERRTDSVLEGSNTVVRLETTVIDPGGLNAHSNTMLRAYAVFDWDYEPVTETRGYGTTAAQRTTYAYYTNSTDTANYGRLWRAIEPDGAWTRYEYDSQGRTAVEYRPFGDAAPEAATNACRLTRYTYAQAAALSALGFPAADVTVTNDRRPRLIVEEVFGSEVSRTYHAFLPGSNVVKRCLSPGAAYTAVSNLCTLTGVITAGTFAGRPWVAFQPDGTLSLYGYNYDEEDEELTITNRTGAGSVGAGVTNGTETVTVFDAAERVVAEYRKDIPSGIVFSDLRSTRDAFGRETCVSNALNGLVATTTYACCGPESRVAFDGIATVGMSHDALRRLRTFTRLGVTTDYTFDSFGNTVRTVRSAGSEPNIITSAGHDGAGRLSVETNELGYATTRAYSTAAGGGRVVTTTFPDGGTRIETYYRDGRPKSVGGTAATPVCFAYGVASGGEFTIEYAGSSTNATQWARTQTDLLGRTVSTLHSGSYTNSTVYDAAGRPVRQADGFTTTLTAYDARGEAFRTAVDMNGNAAIDLAGSDRIGETETGYAIVGGTDLRETVSRVYETAGSATPTVVSTTRAAVDESGSWQIAFGRTNHVAVSRNPAQAVRTETVTRPDGTQVVSVYTNGLLLSVTGKDSLGATVSVETHAHDLWGRRSAVSQTAPNGQTRTTQFAYDKAGQVTNVTVSAGTLSQTIRYAYDAMGRRTQTVQPDGGVVTQTYNVKGELTAQSGARTYPVSYTYTDQGRMATLSTYRNGVGGAADTTGWTYDAARGWLTRKTYADASHVDYTYKANGAPQTRTWARGVSTSFGYDPAGGLTNVVYSDSTPDVGYALDRLGRVETVTDGIGVHTNLYAADGQLESESLPQKPGWWLTRDQDAFGRLSEVAVWDEGSSFEFPVSYGFDSAGRLSTVSNAIGQAAYVFAPDGVTWTNLDMGAVNVGRSFDGLGRLTEIRNVAATGVVYSAAYAYNGADQRTTNTLADGSYWVYEYDQLGQVTAGRKYFADGQPVGGAQYGYAFDTIGNRTSARNFMGAGSPSEVYTANALNRHAERTVPGRVIVAGTAHSNAVVSVGLTNAPARLAARHGEYFWRAVAVDNTEGPTNAAVVITAWLQQVQGTNTNALVRAELHQEIVPPCPQGFAYDADGNLTNDGVFAYTWDAENRLIRVTPVAGLAGCVTRDYRYDHQGRRVEMATATATNIFVYDGWNVVAESIESTNLQSTNRYVWGLDLSGTLQGAGGIGGLLFSQLPSSRGTGAGFAYCYDGNGNVLALVATNGSVAANYEYGPFGETLRASGPLATENPFRFSTKYTDCETGLVYFGYRYLKDGRWLSRDPIGEMGGRNLYCFVHNRPVNATDPLGLLTSWDLWQWLRWLLNTPDEAERLSWEDFDYDGTAETGLVLGWKVQNRAVFDQICRSAPNGHSEHNPSTTQYEYNGFQNLRYVWISQWTGKARLSRGGVGLDKNTDARCVCDFEFGLDFEATDRGDFNPGDRFGWHDIMRDDWFIWLRDHTIFGGDYEMWATGYSLERWTIPNGN